jgi:hypothetical protein
MLPSLHDAYLVSYEVDCENRQIRLCARREGEKKKRITDVIIFGGVEGYQFKNDAFGNIIFSLNETPVERLLDQYGAEIEESYQFTGIPGSWAANLVTATQVLTAKGVQGYILSSSYGLSGWVLAKQIFVEQA